MADSQNFRQNTPKQISLLLSDSVARVSEIDEQVWKEWKSRSVGNSNQGVGHEIPRSSKGVSCYLCHRKYWKCHWFYWAICRECGDQHFALRQFWRTLPADHLQGKRALVTGGRQKLGYQVALMLLRLGAEVAVTSRHSDPEAILCFFRQEVDYPLWQHRLHGFSLNLLCDLSHLELFVRDTLKTLWPDGQLHLLIHNAAQTIASPSPKTPEQLAELEHQWLTCPVKIRKRLPLVTWMQNALSSSDLDPSHGPLDPLDPLGQTQFLRKIVERRDCYDNVSSRAGNNSWNTSFLEISAEDWSQTLDINLKALGCLNKLLIPWLLRGSVDQTMISGLLHVHAEEGHFSRHKSLRHLDTNCPKAALAMMTRGLAGSRPHLQYSHLLRVTLPDRLTFSWCPQRLKKKEAKIFHLLQLRQSRRLEAAARNPQLSLMMKNMNSDSPEEQLIDFYGLDRSSISMAGLRTEPDRFPQKLLVHGVNPKWFSLNEYPQTHRLHNGLYLPPLDDRDAAASLLDPFLRQLPSFDGTWSHFLPSTDF